MESEGDRLLKEAFDIMSCNDPRQEVLYRMATYLRTKGFDAYAPYPPGPGFTLTDAHVIADESLHG